MRRPWAWPLWVVYAMGSGIKDALYTKGVLRAKRLGWPVVSVGSISAGGAGKTPVVIALAELLMGGGFAVDVLSRGYGRTGKGVARVELGEGAAREFGDEPVLMAGRGVEVWVGAERFEAGLAAEVAGNAGSSASLRNDNKKSSNSSKSGFPSGMTSKNSNRNDKSEFGLPLGMTGKQRVHLLDDGFQHRRLARQVDVVLVTLADLDDELLPVGNLREAPGALHRADVLVVRTEERGRLMPRLRAMGLEAKAVWTVRRELRFPKPLGVLGAGLRPLAFCALARPEGFAAELAAAGCAVVDTVVFRDHATYGEPQLAEIEAFAKKLGASGLVTTEKDFVKLSKAAVARLEASCGALMVVGLEAVFEEEDLVGKMIEERLQGTRVADAARRPEGWDA